MMSQQYDDALHMMEAIGGSFVKSLAACYYAADPKNKRRLLDAFPDWFGSYEVQFRAHKAAMADDVTRNTLIRRDRAVQDRRFAPEVDAPTAFGGLTK